MGSEMELLYLLPAEANMLGAIPKISGQLVVLEGRWCYTAHIP